MLLEESSESFSTFDGVSVAISGRKRGARLRRDSHDHDWSRGGRGGGGLGRENAKKLILALFCDEDAFSGCDATATEVGKR